MSLTSSGDAVGVDDSVEEHSLQQESTALRSITGPPTDEFFADVWQQRCHVYKYRPHQDDESDSDDPFRDLIRNGWTTLTDLFQEGRSWPLEDPDMAPLTFKNQKPVHRENEEEAPNPFASYLNGCSVVFNHADTLSGYIANLCNNLQHSFPHAYANAYITPPKSQAVPPHADDRDVLVVQVVGTKTWKVYQRVPIPYPYPHEQVGKNNLKVPQEVLDGPLLFGSSFTLNPGDVLYIPRGFVHEAATADNDLSFHVTVALATHDWSFLGVLQAATTAHMNRIVEHRMALPVQLGRGGESPEDRQMLQQRIDETFDDLKEMITADRICRDLSQKYEQHNQRAQIQRWKCMRKLSERRQSQNQNDDDDDDDNSDSSKNTIISKSVVVGRKAADAVTLSTYVRCATAEEKASLPPSTNPRALNARDNNVAGVIVEILQKFKSDPSLKLTVKDMRRLIQNQETKSMDLVCDLTLLSFTKCCVELGALAIIP